METQSQSFTRNVVSCRARCFDDVRSKVSYLLTLPEELLHALLTSLSPSTLRALAQTCSSLRNYLSYDLIWRDVYARYFDAPLGVAQPCLDGQSWRSESLARELMIDRILTSKSRPLTHHPSVGLIHEISLAYPLHALPILPSRPTARQRYEAKIAATTRPPPHILTAGLGAIVKSDPSSGKISKGFWGPSPNGKRRLRSLTPANFQTHPQVHNPPTTVYLSPDHTFALWGQDGHLTHTALQVKSTNRAQSVNTISLERHAGEILDIHSDGTNHVTAGADGIKHWDSSLACVFASPNPAVLARCSGPTLCAITDSRLYVYNPTFSVDVAPGPYHSLHLLESIFIVRELVPIIERIDLDGGRHTYSTPNGKPLSAVSFADGQLSRIIVAGDIDGYVWMWTPDGVRGFSAMDRKITAITYNTSVIAVASCDSVIKLVDPYTFEILRSFRLTHLSPGDLAIAESANPDPRHIIKHIVFESDVLVASMGRQVYGWRATKKVKEKPRKHRQTRKSYIDISEAEEEDSSRPERQQRAKLDKLGLDPDDALQYAMMLSLDEPDKDEELRDIIEAIRISEHEQ